MGLGCTVVALALSCTTSPPGASGTDTTPDVQILEPDVAAAAIEVDTRAEPTDAGPDDGGALDALDTTAPPAAPSICPTPPGAACTAPDSTGPITGAAPRALFPGGVVCEAVVASSTPCPDGTTCSLGQCVGPGDAIPGGVPVQLVTRLLISDTGCCHDFDGDGALDNGFGNNLTASYFGTGDGDFNDTVLHSITHAHFVLALAFEEGDVARLWQVRAEADPPHVAYAPFPPPADTVLYSRETAYVPGTAVPRSMASLARVGPLEWATAEPIPTVLLVLAAGASDLAQAAHDVRATVRREGDRYTLRLSGYLLLGEVVATLSRDFVEHCPCAAIEGGLVALSEDSPDTVVINPDLTLPAPGVCSGECEQLILAAATGAYSDFLKPDLDVDSDGVKDAISFGLVYETSP